MKSHVIQFRSFVTLKLEPHGGATTWQKVKPGDITSAHIRPYIKNGVELADLTLFNRTLVRGVRFAHFHFLDCETR